MLIPMAALMAVVGWACSCRFVFQVDGFLEAVLHVVAFLRFLPLWIVVLVQAYLALQAYFRADSGDCLDGSCSSALRSYVRYQVDGLLEAVLHVVAWH